jgi:16S rRNA (guanine(1405)-N(7))-methyltransferase
VDDYRDAMQERSDTLLVQTDIRLKQLVEAVRASAKCRYVSPAFIRAVGSIELGRRPTLKGAIKATKNKLHQVGGAYLLGETRYQAWLDQLRAAQQSGDKVEFQYACMAIMGHHASTRERLAILDSFYRTALAGLPPIRTVLDVACGLNPCAIAWMPFAESLQRYYACDIYEDMIAFLNRFFDLARIPGYAEPCDLVNATPSYQVDLAFVLKTVPCLEQIDKAASERLLERLDANHILVSFPVHSLSGRDKGMLANYEKRLVQLSAGKKWSSQRFEFASELAFLLSR